MIARIFCDMVRSGQPWSKSSSQLKISKWIKNTSWIIISVELWNNSNQKVFVQSAMWNEKEGHDAATVRGIPAGQKAEVFDNQAFARKLQSTTVEGSK